MNKRYIIIPDVHGRPFWHAAAKDVPDTPVIFLGDYIDPYDYEGIPAEEVFPCFEEIIELKRAYPNAVTLLLGNHDLHYVDRELEGSRFDNLHANRNRAAILGNADLFDMAHIVTVGATKLLFTHAGVQAGWLTRHRAIFDLGGYKDLADCLNDMWHDETRRPALLKALEDAPYSRWGNCRYGSPIWNDVDDFEQGKEELPGYWQIFGHSQLEHDPVITDYFACLDCRRPFLLTEDGIIEEFHKPDM
jgi:predicted phosphodiesterase